MALLVQGEGDAMKTVIGPIQSATLWFEYAVTGQPYPQMFVVRVPEDIAEKMVITMEEFGYRFVPCGSSELIKGRAMP